MVRATFLRASTPKLGKLAGLALMGAALCAAAPASQQHAAAKSDSAEGARIGRSTGLPLPRFASVKADPARLRRGPGVDYPILWEVTRSGLPVKIVGEYGHWRRVELHDGSRGWMHRVLLSGRRMGLLVGPRRELLSDPNASAPAAASVAEATPMRLDECDRGWCALEASGVRGWAPMDRIWGADASASPAARR